jgi:hypothetical protein
LRRLKHKTRDKGLALRCQMILLMAQGRKPVEIAEALGVLNTSRLNRKCRKSRNTAESGPIQIKTLSLL